MNPAFGETASQSIQAGEFQQQRIQTATREISDRLDAIIARFHNNGVTGKDLQAVLDLRSAVERLATQDMRRVIELLQSAQRAKDANSTQEKLTAAVDGQNDVISQLRDLLSKYRTNQIQEQVSTLSEATATIRQIRQQVADAVEQMDRGSTVEPRQTVARSEQAPSSSSNGNNAASADVLKSAADALAKAAAAVDKVAATLSGASAQEALQQARGQLSTAAMHALGKDRAQARTHAIAAQQALTKAEDALGQMADATQSAWVDAAGPSPNAAADGQTGDAIEKSASQDRGWTRGVTSGMPRNIKGDISFAAPHQGNRIVVMQPPPELVSTQYERLVEQYFKNLSDEPVGPKPTTGGTP